MNYFEFVPVGVEDCCVQVYLQNSGLSPEIEERKIPMVIVCPGGGYEMVSDREAEPVAKEYFAAGFHVLILNYAVKPKAINFVPLCQLAATVAHVRNHALAWNVDVEKIAVCGFSAGGHLVASLGTLYNEAAFLEVWKRTENIRPNAMILGYPVITADCFAHVYSIENVSGSMCGSERYQWFGLDRHVDETTPPTFLWHTAADTVVPVENSLQFAKALSTSKVPYELHILPEGEHGMSVCTSEVGSEHAYNGRWVKWSIAWLQRLFDFHK